MEEAAEEIQRVCTDFGLRCASNHKTQASVYTLPGFPPGASREQLQVNELPLTKDYMANCAQPPGLLMLVISQPFVTACDWAEGK